MEEKKLERKWNCFLFFSAEEDRRERRKKLGKPEELTEEEKVGRGWPGLGAGGFAAVMRLAYKVAA